MVLLHGKNISVMCACLRHVASNNVVLEAPKPGPEYPKSNPERTKMRKNRPRRPKKAQEAREKQPRAKKAAEAEKCANMVSTWQDLDLAVGASPTLQMHTMQYNVSYNYHPT